MSDSLSIDVGSLLPYLEDKVRSIFGKDAATLESRRLLDKCLRRAAEEAGFVQMVGMRRPIPIFDIYQPTRLQVSGTKDIKSLDAIVRSHQSAVIFGLPGSGKTVLMQYLFASVVRSGGNLPILIVLRRPSAVDDLRLLVEHCADGRMRRKQNRKIIVLVDGFDEIDAIAQRDVLAALRDFSSLRIGQYVLTCRSFYPVDINAERFEVAAFDRADSIGFVRAFGEAYGSTLIAEEVVDELEQRGFTDFVRHPLMLALVCIIKADGSRTIPATSIELIRSAVESLSDRWDEARGVSRISSIPLTGHERLACIKRVAFFMNRLIEQHFAVRRVVTEFLSAKRHEDVSPERLLTELARWYGMLVPVGDDWTFAHRTLHDFLAALFWVESRTFNADAVYGWDTRAAFAAALSEDATGCLLKMLRGERASPIFLECIANRPKYDELRVAFAIVGYVARVGDRGIIREDDTSVDVATPLDVFPHASSELLEALIVAGLRERYDKANAAVLVFALLEMGDRGLVLASDKRSRVKDWFGRCSLVRFRRNGTRVSFYVSELLRRVRGA